MLNATWIMDPLHAGGWNYAASVVYRRPLDTDSRISCSIVVEEHDSHHISLPPLNALAILVLLRRMKIVSRCRCYPVLPPTARSAVP